jgi:hypothetical protein
MRDRKKAYIEAFNNATLERKIRSIKTIEACNQIDMDYVGITNNIDSITKDLESIYPKKWDIIMKRRTYKERNTITYGYQEVLAQINPFTLDIVIHFPKINMSNSKGCTHIITDLYIRMSPTSSSEGFTFEGFSGKRMSATKEEIHSCYQHSHMPRAGYHVSGEAAFAYRGFCLGQSEIQQALTILRSKYTEGNFKLFLMQLEEYLNWESIEGVPHIRMSDVQGDYPTLFLNNNIIGNYIEELTKYRTEHPKELDFILEKNSLRVVQNENFEEYLKLNKNSDEYYINIITKKDSLGNYFQYSWREVEDLGERLSSEEDLAKITFIFRRELIQFKITESRPQTEEREFYIHKQIKEHVTEKIEQTIKAQRLGSSISKSINTFERIPEDARQSRLFMPSN